MFLEISQNSLENTCARVSFLIKEALAQVFSCEFCEISKSIFSIEHLWWLLQDIYLRIKNDKTYISTDEGL